MYPLPSPSHNGNILQNYNTKKKKKTIIQYHKQDIDRIIDLLQISPVLPVLIYVYVCVCVCVFSSVQCYYM